MYTVLGPGGRDHRNMSGPELDLPTRLKTGRPLTWAIVEVREISTHA